jgi:hypothetical protein
MAKKNKNKKSVQKQVEAVSAPDNAEPAAAPVVEESTLNEATEPPIQPLEATIDEALTEESSLMLDRNHEKSGQASFDVSTPLETHHEEAAPTTAEMGTTSSTELEKDAFTEETEPSVLQRTHSPAAVPEEPSQLKPFVTESQKELSDASEGPVPTHLGNLPDDHSKHEAGEDQAAGLQPDSSFPEESPPPTTTEDSIDIVDSPNVEPQTFADATEDTSDMIEPAAMEGTPLNYDERYVWS